MTNARAAFSLVELSIVLVILGLLAGGILSGRSLIRAAELRSIGTQYSKYAAATNSFRDKYFALPGDITNATQFWGTSSACGGSDAVAPKTCNGDGNSRIESGETWRFWQHLANAGLIEGGYNGTSQRPASKINPGEWATVYDGKIFSDSDYFDGEYGNTFKMRASDDYYGVLTPEELWNIDMKIDDGMPATGKIVLNSYDGLQFCADTFDGTIMTAKYLFSSSSAQCGIVFRNQF